MRMQLVSAALVSMLLAACNSGDFTGQAKREAAKLPAAATNPNKNTSVDQSQNATANPTQTIYVPVGGNKSLGLPGACTTTDQTIATCNPATPGVVTGKKIGSTNANVGGQTVHVVVYDPAHPPTNVDGASSGGNPPAGTGDQGVTPGSDSASSGGQPGTDLGSILGGLLGSANGLVTTQPNPDTVNFGGDKVFHIGDAAMEGSSCLTQISAFALTGTVYWFNFTVTQPGTNVKISINTICGVDYPDTNYIVIVPGGTAGGNYDFSNHQPLPVGATSAQTIGANLQPGTYALAVKSTKGSATSGADPKDHDDFIVGNIQVVADKPITAGQVEATSDDDCHDVVDPGSGPCTNATTSSGGTGINFGNGGGNGGYGGSSGGSTGGGGGTGSAP